MLFGRPEERLNSRPRVDFLNKALFFCPVFRRIIRFTRCFISISAVRLLRHSSSFQRQFSGVSEKNISATYSGHCSTEQIQMDEFIPDKMSPRFNKIYIRNPFPNILSFRLISCQKLSGTIQLTEQDIIYT